MEIFLAREHIQIIIAVLGPILRNNDTTTNKSSHQKPARAIVLETNRTMTNTVGRMISAMPDDITLGPLSAWRSMPGGGVKDMALVEVLGHSKDVWGLL